MVGNDGSGIYFDANCNLSGEDKNKFLSWFYTDIDSGDLELGVYFWGDLDYSGIGILYALKSNFPHIEAWRAGYEAMKKIISSGEGHTPESTKKGNQTRPSVPLCDKYERGLIVNMEDSNGIHFLDQEAIDVGKLINLSSKEF